MSFRPASAARVAAIALAGLVGLSACNTAPSERRVALEMIDSLELPADQDRCMKEVVRSYGENELSRIGEQNDGLSFSSEDFVDAGTPEFQEFVDRLRGCLTGERSTETTDVPATTDESAGTTDSDVADTTTAPDITVPETTES